MLEILDVAERAPPGRLPFRDSRSRRLTGRTDGSALIYNRSGRGEGWGGLYRFDLATRQSTLIDTGAANRNNNDHVLSFDGTMLGISDQSQASGGRSTIYTVPAGGGTPKRITTLSPSYLHGWSPDGKDLVFTGGRDNEFDIYCIPADGSGVEKSTSPRSRGWTTVPNTRLTAVTSTSIRCAAGRCRSGG